VTNEEVDVAVLVGVADRERALEVGADEVRAEHGAGARDQLPEHAVELGERRQHLRR
jgi:hypothetical protein